jgi:RNAse (barnase) inhibitor barstar
MELSESSVRVIKVDASGWQNPVDFYDALLANLDAPDWHGRNLNALIDSVIVGGINGVEPPYRIEVSGLNLSASAARDELEAAFAALAREGARLFLCSGEASLEVATPTLCSQGIV